MWRLFIIAKSYTNDISTEKPALVGATGNFFYILWTFLRFLASLKPCSSSSHFPHSFLFTLIEGALSFLTSFFLSSFSYCSVYKTSLFKCLLITSNLLCLRKTSDLSLKPFLSFLSSLCFMHVDTFRFPPK